MISEALKFTSDFLNQFLKRKFNVKENLVIINKIIDFAGTQPLENRNKVIITLIHIEQETTKAFHNRNRIANGNFVTKPLDERYNLYLLISPNFEDYNETLNFLNSVLQFFQINGVLDSNSSSLIPEGIQRLEFEFEKGDGYLQMHNLWSALGAKYQPSVIYKMRLVTVPSEEIKGFIPSVKGTSNQTEHGYE